MSYENLNVWRKAIDLTKSIYECTQNFPNEEKFTLVSQMRRAAVSVPSNIAEGSSRYTDKDFAHFIIIARGSLAELHTQIIISYEMGLIADITNKKLNVQIADIGKMLNGLKNNLTSDKALMTNIHKSKVLIIGSGPAGYTAAIYAARANLSPILVEGMQPGGQLTITTDVENFPGFPEITGPELMAHMREQAEKVGTNIIADHIKSVDFSKRPFTAVGESGDTYEGDSVIISTGASARWLGIESEQKFSGFGVSACATCDGFFFRNKKVAVIGGGNSAVEEALYLANIAAEVVLIHRRDSLRSEKILQDRLFKNPKISVIWDSAVDEFIGTENPNNLTGIKLRNLKTNTVTEVPFDGVFIAIGHVPNTEMFKGQLDMDSDNYLITAPDSTKTNIPGVFAAGDVQDKTYRQAVTAAGTGCMAALEAEKFVAGH